MKLKKVSQQPEFMTTQPVTTVSLQMYLQLPQLLIYILSFPECP